MRKIAPIAALLAALAALGGCAHTTPTRGHEVQVRGRGRAVNEVELQQDVQRFTARLMASTHNAAYPISQSFDPAQRMEALRLLLVWQSSALDITMGPVPAVNLLDMIVFVSLSRSVFDRYWLPE